MPPAPRLCHPRQPRYAGLRTWNRRATGPEGPTPTPALSVNASHPALVTEQDFIAAQQIRATRPTCRCRHGHTSTQRAGQPRPKTLYVREDYLVDRAVAAVDKARRAQRVGRGPSAGGAARLGDDRPRNQPRTCHPQGRAGAERSRPRAISTARTTHASAPHQRAPAPRASW
ncbi:recombinase family protein [Amycolatopsis sp. NPDC051061]|uniref:recombinase family protein n=1 Tax=Amycolatopsis sp. NPDC051061 TaxID=3155042 RepID=UPI00341905FE